MRVRHMRPDGVVIELEGTPEEVRRYQSGDTAWSGSVPRRSAPVLEGVAVEVVEHRLPRETARETPDGPESLVDQAALREYLAGF